MGTGPAPDELRKYSRATDDGQQIDLWVHGCVTYDLGRADKIHQTGFIYRVARTIKIPGRADAISYSLKLDEIVPKERLLLYPSPSAEGITN
jgi:hypothetical protein